VGTLHPRSFNMGICRDVYERTDRSHITRMGEDIEFSIRIIENGFTTALIEQAYVYHKRRTNLVHFFKQLHFFGRARINISRFYPREVKLVHILPALFTLFLLVLCVLPLWNAALFKLLLIPFSVFFALLFVHSAYKNKSIYLGLLSVFAAFIQLTGYGIGFLKECWNKVRE